MVTNSWNVLYVSLTTMDVPQMMVWPSWAPRPLLRSASLSGSSVSVAGIRICAHPPKPTVPSVGPKQGQDHHKEALRNRARRPTYVGVAGLAGPHMPTEPPG